MTLQHIVLFAFPDELSDDDWADMKRQVRSWPTEIGGIDRMRLGPSINSERTRGYQYLLYMELADLDALVTYQRHPVHQHFLKWVLERDCKPLAFDYYLDEETVVIP
ncbi:MAG: Stress responsive Barrel Domain [Frankiaceae bacterium]|jgi:hypothetical protein|nr:Stress responsive Barrel Domain [Frankiaceae bacterium]